jgi:hypothetical protein
MSVRREQCVLASLVCVTLAAPISTKVRKSNGRLTMVNRRGYFLPAPFGRFAPYFERPWRRFSTPWLSSAPRTIW